MALKEEQASRHGRSCRYKPPWGWVGRGMLAQYREQRSRQRQGRMAGSCSVPQMQDKIGLESGVEPQQGQGKLVQQQRANREEVTSLGLETLASAEEKEAREEWRAPEVLGAGGCCRSMWRGEREVCPVSWCPRALRHNCTCHILFFLSSSPPEGIACGPVVVSCTLSFPF